MLKYGVIILNYLAYEETINTLSSFFLQKKDDCTVEYIIVDNFSNNESYDKLVQFAKDYENVHVFRTKRNLGFANGNNYGYVQLKKILPDPDYVIISNDDILLIDNKLFSWIDSCYNKNKFAVLGPDVYSIRGQFHQSPGYNRSRDIANLKNEQRQLRKKLIKTYIAYLRGKYVSQTKNVPVWNNDLYESYSEEYTIHGSFQVFSKVYFNFYKTPYDSSTFLYLEEDILKLRCDIKGIKMVYDPSYKLNHLQAVSTNKINKTSFSKEVFRYKNLLKSLGIFIRITRKAKS